MIFVQQSGKNIDWMVTLPRIRHHAIHFIFDRQRSQILDKPLECVLPRLASSRQMEGTLTQTTFQWLREIVNCMTVTTGYDISGTTSMPKEFKRVLDR